MVNTNANKFLNLLPEARVCLVVVPGVNFGGMILPKSGVKFFPN